MIIGKRTRLRGIEREDIPRFVEWLNDPEVRQGLSMVVPMSNVQEQAWFDHLRDRPVDEHPLGIEICTPEGWTLIGNIGLMNFNWHDRHAEVGIFIGDKRYWNLGYGRDAMVLMLRYAFNHLNLNRVYLRVHETNPRAIHSYEKAGFTEEGRMRQGRFQDGKYIDVVWMSALRSEWRDQETV